MGRITYKDLVNCIYNKILIIDEDDYSYDKIIGSIRRIKLVSTIKRLEVKFIERKKRDVNSLKDLTVVFNLHNKKERLNFIYDKMCDYLDYYFIKKNKCVFINNKCISDRHKKYEKDCGCCRGRNGEICKYLKNNSCSIRNLGCKFYICPTLKKKGLSYKNRDFPIFNCFCSFREKIVLRYTIFVPKDKVIERCLTYRW